MTGCQVTTKNLLERLQNLLERKPNTYDVTFCVGPEKKLVRGLKVILKAASPVFEREFEEKWEVGIIKEGEGILLPDFDGTAFEIFIKLTTLDTWSLEALKDLNLPPNQMLNLMTICHHFEMTDGLKNLTEISVSYFRSFNEFEETSFPGLSRNNLQTVLAGDEIQLREFDIFRASYRWAVAECTERGLETSKENIRQVLGGCLYEIRFPLMTILEFAKTRKFYDILTLEESVKIYDFIPLDKSEKLDKFILMFKAKPREELFFAGRRLCLTNGFKIVDNPPFICDGSEIRHAFIPNKNIEIHGLGFVGPIDADAEYDVSFRLNDYMHKKNSNQMNARLSAKKGKVFFWIFDQPVSLEARELTWGNNYNLYFSLKGPPTSSVQRKKASDSCFQEGGGEFLIKWFNDQLSVMLFKYA